MDNHRYVAFTRPAFSCKFVKTNTILCIISPCPCNHNWGLVCSYDIIKSGSFISFCFNRFCDFENSFVFLVISWKIFPVWHYRKLLICDAAITIWIWLTQHLIHHGFLLSLLLSWFLFVDYRFIPVFHPLSILLMLDLVWNSLLQMLRYVLLVMSKHVKDRKL